MPYDEYGWLGAHRTFIGWNPDLTGQADATAAFVGKGGFMYPDDGKRYAYGEFPTKAPKFFDTKNSVRPSGSEIVAHDAQVSLVTVMDYPVARPWTSRAAWSSSAMRDCARDPRPIEVLRVVTEETDSSDVVGSGEVAGSVAVAGSVGVADSVAVAGSAATAGSVAVAGSVSTAGSVAVAGSAGTAGSVAVAGSAGTAGSVAVAGSAGTAGSVAVAGSAGTAGSVGVIGSLLTVLGVGIRNCIATVACIRCRRCIACVACIDCVDCIGCVGCVGLRGAVGRRNVRARGDRAGQPTPRICARREHARIRGGEGPQEAVQSHQHGAPEMECEADAEQHGHHPRRRDEDHREHHLVQHHQPSGG